MTYSPSTPFSDYLQGEQLKYPELKLEDIEKLKQSLADDPELPPITDKKYLAFLHSCEFDLELAKKTVKKCYKFYFDVPEVFCELDPLGDEAQKSYISSSVGLMPTINTDKGDRVLYLQFKNYNPDVFEYVRLYKYLLMWMEYTLLMYGTCDGYIIVLDSKGLSWRHIMKIPLGITKKMLRFLETSLPVRLKSIHIVNGGTATQMIMKIVQRFANQDLLNKIKIYSAGSEEVFDHVPKKIMPIEIGGLGKSHNDYNDELYKSLGEHCDFFYGLNETLNNHMMYLNEPLVEDEDDESID